jgi:GT2 family glycosyltransferase
MVPGSAAASSDAKPYAYEAAKRALAESLRRRGVDGWVEEGKTMGWYRIRYRIPGEPLVSAIIPTRDRADLLAKCLDKLRHSKYKRIEIIVVDNGSVEAATRTLLDARDLIRVADPGDFNFSRLINSGAAAAKGDYLLLLNNDIEAINEDWIEAMLEHAQRPEVGVVGARLLYPSGRPQHEGVALGIGGTFAGHVDWRDYLGLSHAVRNCSAVTAAAAMTRRSVFNELRGFDESFRVAYGDVDYCLRARQRGYLVVYTPYALLYHHESASRGNNHPPEDEIRARKRWGHLTDPYYSDALDEVLEPWVYGPAHAAAESRRG